MIEHLDELYREVILDHFKNSSHRGELASANIKADGSNPLCGDEMSFFIDLKDEHIAKVRFISKGCAISQAAASMLSAELEGKTLSETAKLIDAMKHLMQGESPNKSVDLGDLESLAGVRKFPVRVKCAALSWNVVEQAIREHSKGKR